MLAASFLAIFLIPVCYYAVEKLSGRKITPPAGGETAAEPGGH
jgi:hypothetical protein